MNTTRALTDALGELQALRNHLAHWGRGGIDAAALKRADEALAALAGTGSAPAEPAPAGRSTMTTEEIVERIGEAHDASLDDDHRGARQILSLLMKHLNDTTVSPAALSAPASIAAEGAEPAPASYPPCQGMNCSATDGKSHSPECFAEHIATIDPGVGERHREHRYAGYKGESFPAFATEDQQAAWVIGVKAQLPTAPVAAAERSPLSDEQREAIMDAADEWSGYVVEDTAPMTLSKWMERALAAIKAARAPA